jgi:hypothetical protein
LNRVADVSLRKSPPVDSELIDRIVEFVDSYIINHKRFPSIQDVIKQMGGTESKCRRHITFAIKGGKLDYVFSSRKPTRSKVLATTRVINHMVSIPELAPSWVAKYQVTSRASADTELKKARSQTLVYDDLESLLWRKDRPLALACGNVLLEMGFKVEYKEREGDHDLEIIEGKYYAIAEVTGSAHQIDISNADSLSRYYIKRKYEDNLKDITALLIGNAFHNADIAERKMQAFTQTVLRAVKNEYSYIYLISTVDLYEAIGRVLDGHDTRETFRDNFKSGRIYYQAEKGTVEKSEKP